MAEDNQTGDRNSNSALDKLQADLDNATNGWKRAAADFENYKKQKEKENKELVEFAREVAVAKILPTLDALEQAFKHIPEYTEDSAQNKEFGKLYSNWQVGVNGIIVQLDKVLEELGVKKIEAMGKKFDPYFHEAVKVVENGSEDGVVVEELQSGFLLNGKVIRPSQVTISRKAAESGKI